MDELKFEEKKHFVFGQAGDPLWFEWFLICDIFKYKIVRIILWLNLMFCFIKYAVQIYYFKENPSNYVRYGILFFGEPYAIAAEIGILWKMKITTENFKCFPYWTFDSCGERIRLKIEHKLKIHKTCIIILLSLVVIASCVVLYPKPSDKIFLFPVVLIEEHWPKQAWFLSLAYRSTLVPLGYCALVHPILTMYGAQNMTYQTFLLEELYRQILTGSEDKDKDRCLYADKAFQDEVQKRIAFCVNRQNDGIKFGVKTNEVLQQLFALLAPGGYSVGMAILMYYFSYKLGYFELTLSNALFPTLMSFNAVGMFVGLIISGQNSEEATQKLTSAVEEWEWWAMDTRNQKTMLLILSATREFQMQVTPNIILNYDFGVSMVKTIYSLTSLLATVEQFQ